MWDIANAQTRFLLSRMWKAFSERTKRQILCENEGCKVIFVKYPDKHDIAELFFKPSSNKKTIMKIEKTPIKIQYR
jgi:hypothetical protein